MEARKNPGREEAIAELVLTRTKLTDTQAALFHEVFGEMFAAHFQGIWKVIARRGAPVEDLEDVMQETQMHFYFQTLAQGFPESIRARLYWLAVSKASNARRKADREPWSRGLPSSRSEVPGSGPSPSSRLDRKEKAVRLFFGLSPAHRAVIEAVLLGEEGHQEAADELGIARTTLTSRLAAALEKLKEMAEAFPDDERGKR